MSEKVLPGQDESQEEKALAKRARSRANYIRACKERVSELLEQTLENVRKLTRDIARVRQRHFKYARLAAFAHTELSAEQRSARFLAELEKVRSIPKVVAVRRSKGAVLIYTDTLCAAKPSASAEHEIGKFMIMIGLDGQVLWFNSTRRIDGALPKMNAPNVYADGTSACTEFETNFLELIAQLELAAMADMAIQYIETYEDDELWSFIDNWPLSVAQEAGEADAKRR